MSLLITPEELATLIDADAPVRVLDVRWRLDAPDGRAAHAEGHIPTAVYVDLDDELAGPASPAAGRHPLPSRQALQDAARRWGISAGDIVVVYDDAGSVPASRAWWLLSHSGVTDVRVLDGGLGGWRSSGGALEEGEVSPTPGDVELTDLDLGIGIDIDDAAGWSERGVLVDVRAAERYRGEVEPIDPIAGHIPGAVNLALPAFVEAGRFRDPAALRDAFAAAGAVEGRPVAAYCGSGVGATQAALAGALAGISVAVYPGSWSQWSNTPGRPVATGATP